SFLILFIGVLMVAFTERKQGLHDMLAGTYVIKSF
ncbi:MAG: RDD family protein, partial [Chthoniobacterales bacterium]|nr:RDD family protein [Chthoniobacterales bacterium]